MVTIKLDKVKDQRLWDAFIGSGVAGNIFLYELIKESITSIKKKLNKLRSDNK